MFLPNIVRECLKSLSCIELDFRKEYLKYEPIFLCDDDYKYIQNIVVWPILITWSLIFSSICFIYLYSQEIIYMRIKFLKSSTFSTLDIRINIFIGIS